MGYDLMTAVVGIVVATYGFLRAILHFTQDANEPPTIDYNIPFLGPIAGMVTKKSQFYKQLRDAHSLPIYTLRLPGSKLYVINSTNLIPVAQRQHKALAFGPIEVRAAENVMGMSKASIERMSKDIVEHHGYIATFGKAIHPALSPGPGLDAINHVAVQTIASSLAKLETTRPTRVKMFEWVRHEMFMATSDGVYGPQNPLRDPKIEAAWYKFEPTISLFMLNLFPKVLAKEGLRAREEVVSALIRYYENGGHLEASALTKYRYEHNAKHKILARDIPRTEVGNIFAIIGNTGPASFWLIWHLYSNPAVLGECRREVLATVQQNGDARTIDITNIKTSCPVLLSTLREVLRFYGTGVSVRVVLEDHMLDGKYLLKKGNTLMIPAPVQHTLRDVWGDDADRFDHRRFVRSTGKKRPNPVAFRGFGGGTVLCPGRHFATTEILAFAAFVLMRFDIRPVRGEWAPPGTEKAPGTASVAPPDADVEIDLVPRSTEEWHVAFSASDRAMELSVEDIPGDGE